MMLKRFATIVALGLATTTAAQQVDTLAAANNAIEGQLYEIDESLADDESLEPLMMTIAEKININTASADELLLFNILTQEQAQQIINHRKLFGDFMSLYELQAVESLDAAVVNKIIPHLTVSPSKPLAQLSTRMRNEGSSYILLRYDHNFHRARGFDDRLTTSENRFQGSTGRMITRYRTNKPGDFSFGFTAENDAGEKLKVDPKKKIYGPDFLSLHLQLQNKGKLKNIIVGDYQLQVGQGLVYGGLFRLGKGGETITTTKRVALGARPYTSLDENNYLRGITTTYQITPSLEWTAIHSHTKRDGTIAPGEDEQSNITSLSSTGLHRNRNELGRRKIVTEKITGSILQFTIQQLELGAVLQHLRYSFPLSPTPTRYNANNFTGNENLNYGLNANWTSHNINVFGEVARSHKDGYAYIVGTIVSFSRAFDVALVNRQYSSRYHPFYANAFAENSVPKNERGIYYGWKYKPHKKWTYSGYVDFFEFPAVKFRTYAPSTGFEWLLRASYQPSRKTQFFIQSREETKVRNLPTATHETYKTDTYKKNNYWLSAVYSVHENIVLKTRIHYSTFHFNGSSTDGLLVAQDLQCHAGKLKMTLRYSLFDTDDYDNRQYLYENDVWLAYSIPPLHGIGNRSYVLLEYKVNKTVTFWVRYSSTAYQRQQVIGSGIDAIDGNTKNDIKFETRIKL